MHLEEALDTYGSIQRQRDSGLPHLLRVQSQKIPKQALQVVFVELVQKLKSSLNFKTI